MTHVTQLLMVGVCDGRTRSVTGVSSRLARSVSATPRRRCLFPLCRALLPP